MKKNKIFVFIILLFYSSILMSGGRATAAIPTEISIIGIHNGFMIKGIFGNPSNCDKRDAIWVKGDHPQYDKIYSTALAAFMANKKITTYIHGCEPVPWYAGTSITYNTLSSSGDFKILK